MLSPIMILCYTNLILEREIHVFEKFCKDLSSLTLTKSLGLNDGMHNEKMKIICQHGTFASFRFTC